MLIYVMERQYDELKKIDTLLSTRLGDTVKCFTNPEMLLAAVTEALPKVVLLDGDIPGIGVTVQRLAQIGKAPKVVLMSADRSKAMEAYDINAYGFLLKPIDGEKLQLLLHRIRSPLLSKIKNKVG